METIRNTLNCASVITMIALATVCSACDPAGFVPGPQPINGTLYAPYLESVDAPANAQAGDQVSIVLHFSANLNPGLFADPLMQWDQSSAAVGQTRFDINYYLVSSAELNEAPPPAPPGNTVELDRVFNEPGTYTYRFWSAASSSQGGTGYPGDITYGMGIPSEPGPNAKLTEVIIEVLPAD